MLLHNRSRKEYVWYPDDPLENCLVLLCPDTTHTQNHSTETRVSRPADRPALTASGYGEVPPEPGLGLRLHPLSLQGQAVSYYWSTSGTKTQPLHLAEEQPYRAASLPQPGPAASLTDRFLPRALPQNLQALTSVLRSGLQGTT